MVWSPEDVLIYDVFNNRTKQIFHVVFKPVGKDVVFEVECGGIYAFTGVEKQIYVIGIYAHGGRK